MQTRGIHLLCELVGCNSETLVDLDGVHRACEKAASDASLTVVAGSCHQFSPSGVSVVLSLAESHLSVHTWPETGYAAVDVYTCGERARPRSAVTSLAASLGAKNMYIREVTRGLPASDWANLAADRSLSGTSAVGGTWFWWNPGRHDTHAYEIAEWIAIESSPFHSISIARNQVFGRMLMLDGAVQSSELDEHVYHDALVHPAMCMHPNPRRVLVLGGGEGATLREVLRHRTVIEATMVDIDARVVALAREYLPNWSDGAFDDPRCKLVIGDGARWLDTCTDQFDVIIMDLTDQIEMGPSFEMYTRPFYRQLSRRLAPAGILVVQAGELSLSEYFSHCTIRNTLQAEFAHTRTYTQHIASFAAQWSWILASQQPLPCQRPADLVDRIAIDRLGEPARFYDGASHNKMFNLSKDIAQLLPTSGVTLDSVSQMAAYKRDYDANQQTDVAVRMSPAQNHATPWQIPATLQRNKTITRNYQ